MAGLVTLRGPKLEQAAPEGLYPVEGTHTGAVHEELQSVGRTHNPMLKFERCSRHETRDSPAAHGEDHGKQ